MAKRDESPFLRLRAWRAGPPKRMTQGDAAKYIGMDQGDLCRLEKGERKPTIDQARRIQELTEGAIQAWEWGSERKNYKKRKTG